jgi:ribosome-associated protein
MTLPPAGEEADFVVNDTGPTTGQPARPVRPRRFATDPATLEKEVVVEPYRAPGPGGQRKNRKETAVRLTHPPSGIVVVASERRSQAQNREIAFERLIKKLVDLNRPRKRRIPTKPSAGAIRRQQENKEKLSRKKRLRLKSSTSQELD